MMNYLRFTEQKERAIASWNKSQYDLCDVVLSLTDQGIVIGGKLYHIFSKPEVLDMMQYFICDFSKMKQDLGIVDNYVERDEDIYSSDFNPKRNVKALTLNTIDMRKRSKIVYRKFFSDLENIVKLFLNK